MPDQPNASVLRWQHLPETDQRRVIDLLASYGLALMEVAEGVDIPGSFWGDDEAGLVGHTLQVRGDTPIHSLLHESGHYICMDTARRSGLHTDAGGDDDEECAVCYLQVLMADRLAIPREKLFADMDAWGYSFRLGSSARWFAEDAADALQWLLDQGIATQLPVSGDVALSGLKRP